jgi:hypothetical protein
MRVQRFAIATAVYSDKCLVLGCRASIKFLLLHLIFSGIVTAVVQKVTKQLFLVQDGSNASTTFCDCDRRV